MRTRAWQLLGAAVLMLLCAAAPIRAQDCSPDQCNAGMCVDGSCVTTPITGGSCDDGNQCTGPDTCTAGICTGEPLNGTPCDDNNPCTVNDTCTVGACGGTAVADGTACGIGDCGMCFNGFCVPDLEKMGNPCEFPGGENPCIVASTCMFGTCFPQLVECPNEDENLCTFEFCNPANGMCESLPVDPCDECESCDPASGDCVVAGEGQACDDLNPCTGDGMCFQGTCVSGGPVTPGTATPTSTPDAATATPTATSAIATETATEGPTATSTPIGVPTATATGVPTGTATATATPSEPTATATETTGVATATQTSAPTATATGMPTGTATATATMAPTATATGMPTGTATATATMEPTATATGMPTGTATATATATPVGPTATNTVGDTPTATSTPIAPATNTATATRTGTVTPTPLPVEATIAVGSASGAPDTDVTIDVVLTSSVDVAGTQNDISFDAEAPIAANGEGDPDCTVNPAINKVLNTVFQPVGCTPGTDCTSIRAIVLAFDNTDPIPSGSVLYQCRVAIAADATGIHPLTCSNPSAGDAEGNRIGAICTDGMITVVSGPTPTATGEATATLTHTPTGGATPTVTPPTEATATSTPESPTATATVGVQTATATRTPGIPFPTSTRRPPPADDDGCQVGPASTGTTWLLALPGVLIWLRRRRR